MSVTKKKTIALLDESQKNKFQEAKLKIQADEGEEMTDGETVKALAERYLSE